MKYQGRGSVYLQERNSDGTLGAAVKICPDTYTINLTTESFEHVNKCGAQDVPDYRGIKSSRGEVRFTFTDVEDAKFAIAALGTVNAAEGSPASVTGELIPSLAVGDYYFLGGKERNRNITSLVLKDNSTPQVTLVENTHYSLDEDSGRIDILSIAGLTMGLVADYSHANPAHVSLLTAAQKEYFASFEAINKANNNDSGSFELYKVRFDPAQNIDMLSDELQAMELVGTALADTDIDSEDTEFGQFGRRVL